MTTDELRLIGEWLNKRYPIIVDSDGDRVIAAANELDRLRAWKAEALYIIEQWDKVWELAGCPGPLGSSKAASVAEVLTTRYPSITDHTEP
jgi:hypothetical protein